MRGNLRVCSPILLWGLLRALYAPIRAGSPRIGQSYFVGPPLGMRKQQHLKRSVIQREKPAQPRAHRALHVLGDRSLGYAHGGRIGQNLRGSSGERTINDDQRTRIVPPVSQRIRN